MYKRLIFAVIAAVCMAFGAHAQIEKGMMSIGPKLGYISHNKSAVAGIVYQYNITERFRLSPEIGWAFRHNDENAFMADINLHMPVAITEGGSVALYPLVGVAFNSWGYHWSLADGLDVSKHISRFGANIGAGFDLRCSQSIKMNIEAKYSFIKSYSSVYIGAGVSYLF